MVLLQMKSVTFLCSLCPSFSLLLSAIMLYGMLFPGHGGCSAVVCTGERQRQPPSPTNSGGLPAGDQDRRQRVRRVHEAVRAHPCRLAVRPLRHPRVVRPVRLLQPGGHRCAAIHRCRGQDEGQLRVSSPCTSGAVYLSPLAVHLRLLTVLFKFIYSLLKFTYSLLKFTCSLFNLQQIDGGKSRDSWFLLRDRQSLHT